METKVTRKQIADGFNSGLTDAQIAAKHGCSRLTVSNKRREMGYLRWTPPAPSRAKIDTTGMTPAEAMKAMAKIENARVNAIGKTAIAAE